MPSSHWPPVQVEIEPLGSIVTNCGGEKVAERTGSGLEGLMLQAILDVGDRKAPFSVAAWSGDETITVAVVEASSGRQPGGGPMAFASSLKT